MSIFQPALVLYAPRCLTSMMLIVGACFLSGCALLDASNASSDEASDVSQTDDISSDTGVLDVTQHPTEDVTEDTSDTSDTSEPPGWRGQSLDVAVRVAPGSLKPQYQASAAFDGSGIWIVYSEAAGDDSAEDNTAHNIMATRVSCSGEQRATPIQLNEEPVYLKSPSPSLAIKDGTVYFTWSTKPSQVSQVTKIMVRTYDIDGEALMAQPKEVNFEVDFKSGNWLNPAVVALSATQAVIVGSGTNSNDFQVFLQAITNQGDSLGAALPVNSEPDNLQRLPVATVAASGDIWVAWQQVMLDTTTTHPWYTHYRSFASDTLSPTSNVTVVRKPTPVAPTRSGFSAPTADSEQVYFVLTSRSESGPTIYLGNATNFTGLTPLSQGEGTNEYPSVAAGEGGGIVAWHVVSESTETSQMDLYTQTFINHHNYIEQNTPRRIASFPTLLRNERFPGSPSIVPVGGEYYFVVWNENTAPMQSTLHASFIRF